MNETEKLIKGVEQYGAHNYHPLRVMLSRGEGAKVWDVEGKEYLDFLACYSALNFGHSHPRLIATLKAQAEQLAVCSRAFHSEELSLFSEELAKFCGMEMVLTMNSGSDRNGGTVVLPWGRRSIRSESIRPIIMGIYPRSKENRPGSGPLTS